MNLYDDASVPVRTELVKAHEAELARLSNTGTWWDGPQRAELVAAARSARDDSGQQENTASGPNAEPFAEVPEAALALARQVAVEPQVIDRAYFDDALAQGLSEESYVEVVSVASSITNLDIFAAGIGVTQRDLPAPTSGTPSRVRPATAIAEGAFAATIPSGKSGGEEGHTLYDGKPAANILRCASLVPEEAAAVIRTIATQYVAPGKFEDLGFTFDAEIARSQVEFLAARVSAFNECFY